MLLPLVTMSRVNAQEAVPGTIVDSNGLKAVMTIDSQWQGFCNGTISITNTGTETIDNFAYSFDFPYEITNIWNAVIVEHASGVYTVKNLGWNQDIPAGGTASIGFTAAVDGDVTLPTFFVLNTKEADVAAESAKVEYISYSDWDDGFSGAIRVTNLSSTSIEDYRLSLSFAREITTISNATILSHEGSNYSITNNGSNQNLAPNQTIEIGINGSGGTVTDTITSYSVRQITTRFDLVSDTDGDTYADWLEVCVRGSDPLIPEGITPTPTPTSTPTPTPPDVSPTPIPPIDYETDTDGDLLPDYFEVEIGTNTIIVDTDGDALTDYWEIILGYNPLVIDSNGDGICDYDEDIDRDGLSFREENDNQTSFVCVDTDMDGLTDYDEVCTYFTNPLQIDSDSDDISDCDEIDLNLDPLNPSTKGVPDNEFTKEYVFQENSEVLSKINTDSNPYQLSFTIGAAGNVASNIQVKESPYAGTMLNDAILGIVPEISYDENMLVDSVKICFQIDTEVIANPESVYASVNQEFSGLTRFCIFRFDEDLSMLLPVETQYDELSQTAYYETNELGSYCLMDMEIWLQSIGISPQDLSVEVDPILYSDGSEQMLTVDLLDETTKLDSSEEYAVNFEASVAQDSSDIISLLSSSEVVADGYFKGHRYAVLDKGLTWEDAKAYCEYMAGHLVTITSQEEQAFIESILVKGKRNSYWIGAEISASGTYPKWITGELISYKNYYRNQPDDAYGWEDALMIYRFNNGTGPCFGFWNDLKRDGTCGTQPFFGTSNFGLICEWETAVKLVYATSLKACTIPNILSKVADDDADGDGIPNWQEIDPDSTLGYWNIDGTYIPKSFANILAEHGAAQVFARYNVNPLIISVIPLDSNPQDTDTDRDGAADDIDATPTITNGPINYVIYGTDDVIVNSSKGYEKYFSDKNAEFEYIQVSTYSDFVNVWENLQHEYIDGSFTDKIAYSKVDDFCIFGHGNSDSIFFGSDGIAIGDIRGYDGALLDKLTCSIDSVDIIACDCATFNQDGKCIASEFASSSQIGEVYAWNGSVHYFMFVYSSLFQEGVVGYCRFFKDTGNNIIKEEIGNIIVPIYRS